MLVLMRPMTSSPRDRNKKHISNNRTSKFFYVRCLQKGSFYFGYFESRKRSRDPRWRRPWLWSVVSQKTRQHRGNHRRGLGGNLTAGVEVLVGGCVGVFSETLVCFQGHFSRSSAALPKPTANRPYAKSLAWLEALAIDPLLQDG